MVRQTSQTHPDNLPEAPLDYPEIAYKPPRQKQCAVWHATLVFVQARSEYLRPEEVYLGSSYVDLTTAPQPPRWGQLPTLCRIYSPSVLESQGAIIGKTIQIHSEEQEASPDWDNSVDGHKPFARYATSVCRSASLFSNGITSCVICLVCAFSVGVIACAPSIKSKNSS